MTNRIDLHPTHSHGEFKLRAGKPLPFGATLVPGGVNFSVFSRYATACSLVLFKKHATQPFAEIPFPREFRTGNVFSMILFDVDYENIEYGYRMEGPYDPENGHRFDRDKVLLDPYARLVSGRDVWGKEPDWNNIFPHRGQILADDFDWEDDCQLEIPFEDLVIYEMHVRGFTAHASAKVKHPGTFAAIRDKIPYLKDLGINCLELMPVHTFDEFENSKLSPVTGERLLNYWGYSNVGFFAPKAGFAATGKFGMQADELKNTIKTLHKNGIEVILDVVFNHTAEGNERGHYISYRGIDNKTYYMLTPEGYYYNFSGCGNTLNCNNPIVRNMILDCLRYWVTDYHVDGFRFDLAAILGRDQNGAPMSSPPLLETLAFDPILGKCKLIAEAWDAGGLYQVGSFPSWGRWAEWNGKYRDDLRKFLKGEPGLAGAVSQRIQGSPDLYQWEARENCASVNFITCHDGFTLMDMVSYNGKHNEANGENNSDGGNDNHSWNCGWEGPCDDKEVNRLRIRQIKNAAAMLLVSHGTPMILAGDEFGNTQYGNNNAYCQDNELSWLNWEQLSENAEIHNFFRQMIAFRKASPMLRYSSYAMNAAPDVEVSWHGTSAWNADWSGAARTVAFMCRRWQSDERRTVEPDIYVAMNMHWDAHGFELPGLDNGRRWHVFANTGMESPDDIVTPGNEILLDNQQYFMVGPRSVIVLVGK